MNADEIEVTINIRKLRLEALEKLLDVAAATGDPPEYNQLVEEKLALLRTGGGPLPGMPCTYEIGSDAYAGEVLWVSKGGASLKARVGGRERAFTRRKDGCYRQAGENFGRLYFLTAKDYRDPSF